MEPWSRVSVRAAADAGLSRLGFRVFIAIGSFVDANGFCFPSQGTLAKVCNLSRRQSINEAIQELERRGYLAKEPALLKNGRFSGCLYRIIYNSPPNFAEIAAQPSAARLKSRKARPGRVPPVPDTVNPGRVHDAPDTGRVPPAPDSTVSAPGGTLTAQSNYPKSQQPKAGVVGKATEPSPAPALPRPAAGGGGAEADAHFRAIGPGFRAVWQIWIKDPNQAAIMDYLRHIERSGGSDELYLGIGSGRISREKFMATVNVFHEEKKTAFEGSTRDP